MAKKTPADAGKGWSGPDALAPLLVPIDSLSPDPSNARRHNDRNIEAIIASLHRFGQRFPIVVQKQGMIVRAGNGRIEAMKRLGWRHVAAVVVDESSVDATAFAIADNRTAELAEWDDETLASLLQSMDGAEREVAGFTEAELGELLEKLTPDVQINEDEVPEPPVDPITKPGDLWLLGEHRLLCGDSTKADDVARLLDGRTPFLMVTDPPYGVEYDAEWRNDAIRSNGKPIADRAVGKVTNDDRCDWAETYKLFPGHVAYVWHDGRYASEVAINMLSAGLKIRCQLIWSKSNFAIGRGHYHWGHEPCWYAVRENGSAKWCGDRTQSTVWNIPKPSKSDTGHSTQKPVECMARPIRNHGGPGDDIYDPFLGSGTTLIAAEQLGRKCYGMEISPQYCDVIVKRWETLTGRKAERAER